MRLADAKKITKIERLGIKNEPRACEKGHQNREIGCQKWISRTRKKSQKSRDWASKMSHADAKKITKIMRLAIKNGPRTRKRSPKSRDRSSKMDLAQAKKVTKIERLGIKNEPYGREKGQQNRREFGHQKFTPRTRKLSLNSRDWASKRASRTRKKSMRSRG